MTTTSASFTRSSYLKASVTPTITATLENIKQSTVLLQYKLDTTQTSTEQKAGIRQTLRLIESTNEILQARLTLLQSRHEDWLRVVQEAFKKGDNAEQKEYEQMCKDDKDLLSVIGHVRQIRIDSIGDFRKGFYTAPKRVPQLCTSLIS